MVLCDNTQAEVSSQHIELVALESVGPHTNNISLSSHTLSTCSLVDSGNIMAGPPSHLTILHVATAGKQGEELGSDESQIVNIVYLLYDVLNNKVC